jgi:uncharacterized protein YkwD
LLATLPQLGCGDDPALESTLVDAASGFEAGSSPILGDTSLPGTAVDGAVPADAGSLPMPEGGATSADAGARPMDAGQVTRDASTATPDSGAPVGGGSQTEICMRWNADRANLAESTFNGDLAACMPGTMSADALANAERLFNLYRSMAGLPLLKADAASNQRAQACALLMYANNTITHTPPSTFKCYTAEAAQTAGSSSLATGPSVSSVDGYMLDPGNNTTLGHRRWILSNMLKGIGFGSAGRYSCQFQPPGAATGGKPWVAWPPPGTVPLQAIRYRLGSVDTTGWSLQSDSINLQSAQITVSSNGAPLAVTTTALGSGYGSRYAIAFAPMGWTSQAGQTYAVHVDGVSTPIDYTVQVVDCSK